MRIFIAISDQTGNTRKSRLTLVDCNTTNDLLKRICGLCNIEQLFLIAKLKQQIFNIRIIEGWPLDMYPIRQGSQIIVQILPEGLKNSPQSSPRITRLAKSEKEVEQQIQDNNTSNTTAQPDQQLSFYSDEVDWTKYFEDSLQQFLNAVRNKSIEQASNILKAEPECNDEKLLLKILQKKSNFLLNQTGQCGRAALHEAVQEKDLDMVQFLLIKSSDPNVVSLDQYTPLQLAIALGSSPIFQTLISHPKIDLNRSTSKGTALHVAIQQQKLDYAQKLLKAGIDSNIQNKDGLSAIKLCEKLNIKSLKFKLVEKPTFETPYILRGIVYKVSSFGRSKQRLLISNPFKNQLLLYEDEQVEERIALNKLSSVSVIKEKSWNMKKDYFYFLIKGSNLELTLSVKNVRIGAQWIQDLLKCIKFCKMYGNQTNRVPVGQQLIEILDDAKNIIKLHKMKINGQKIKQQIKKVDRMSLFDLKPIYQNNQEQDLQNPLIVFDNSSSKLISEDLVEKNILPYALGLQTPVRPFIQSTIQYQQPNYLRESQLLGSVIGNQMLSSSLRKKSENIRQGSIIFEKKPEPLVCYKDFQILRQLGNGSFGKVFLARHKREQKLYALKVLNKKKLMAKKQLKYAVGQANILKKVDSPFIIKLYYSFQTPSNLYIAIDYCPNGDLSQILTQQDKMSQRSCKFYIAQLILAVEYLHKQKIIYRDLKPQNILIAHDGYIRLTDFNLSKQNNFSMSFCGSPAYLSPQMLEKKGVGFEADIYGIGCVLYEMLVGQPPYFDDDIETLYQNIRKGKLKFPSGISKPAKSLISGLLEKDVSKRLGVKTMNQIKNHEFFHGFDWKSLQKLQMKMPMQLQNKFHDKTMGLEVIREHGFQDADYQSSSGMINRIKNFTFAREK